MLREKTEKSIEIRGYFNILVAGIISMTKKQLKLKKRIKKFGLNGEKIPNEFQGSNYDHQILCRNDRLYLKETWLYLDDKRRSQTSI